MSDSTMIGPITKDLRIRLKVFLAKTGLSYEKGIDFLLDVYYKSK